MLFYTNHEFGGKERMRVWPKEEQGEYFEVISQETFQLLKRLGIEMQEHFDNDDEDE